MITIAAIIMNKPIKETMTFKFDQFIFTLIIVVMEGLFALNVRHPRHRVVSTITIITILAVVAIIV